MEAQTVIIGSMGETHIPLDAIEATLTAPEQDLEHGGTFTGKPVTHIRLTAQFVLKLHLDGGFDSREMALLWGKKKQEKTRATELYHPEKTWFIHFQDDLWRIGNITPRMQPLHTCLENASDDQILQWINHVCRLYLHHAATFHERLDEGLSNFGLTGNGELYYLDDDFYSWDHFLSFSAMITGWIRKHVDGWFDAAFAPRFAQALADSIKQEFAATTGIDALHTVYEHLGSHFLSDAAQERCEAFRKALIEAKDQQQQLFGVDEKSVPSLQEVTEWFESNEPVALLADIHANRPALLKVLDDLTRQNISRILVLGDIVGYGPHPAECIDIIRQTAGIVCLRGNHDHMVGTGKAIPSMHGSRLAAAAWTIEHLAAPYKKWLTELPLQWRAKPWIALHGAPQDATFFNAYVYDRTADSNLHWMQEHDFLFCLHGHSHLQGTFTLMHGEAVRDKSIGETVLKHTTLICPGAVGQPRAGIPGCEYAIIYPLERRLINKRLDYDIEEAITDMRREGLPSQLINMLRHGQ